MAHADHFPLQAGADECRNIATKMATCPFIGAALACGELPIRHSTDNPLAAIADIERLGNSGGGDLGTHVLKLFARGNHSRWVVPPKQAGSLVPERLFSLHFGGSQGAHAGHSGILLGDPRAVGEGRLSREDFQRLAQLADANGRLSIDAVGDFIAANLRRDDNAKVLPWVELVKHSVELLGEFKDVILQGGESEQTQAIAALTALLGQDHLAASSGEWGLLFAFLKNSPRSDDGDIALADVEEMFLHQRLPAGWETWEKSTLAWIKATLRLIKEGAFAYYALAGKST